MSRLLRRKLRRDLRRQWPQFVAVAAVVAIAIAVFVAASDAYRNLGDSFDRAYADQRLPDVILAGPSAPSALADLGTLPGDPLVTVRRQAEVGARIGDHALLVRVVSVPASAQPEVSALAVRSGRLPADGEVLLEQHLADHNRLSPGARIELLGTAGPLPLTVSGSGLSTEYFWPARSQQETVTTADQFGVVFAPDSTLDRLGAPTEAQLALYARDRSQADALVAAARRLAGTQDLTVTTRQEQPSFVALDQDVRTFGDFANLLPLAFLVAGVLGGYILLARLVHSQRAVIGTLTANGVGAATLRRHYLGYGLAAGALAVPPGLVAGYLIGAWYTGAYTGAIGLPIHVVSLHPASLVIATLAGLAAPSLAAWGPARAAARAQPGEAMRITPAGSGHRLVLGRLVPPVRALPTRWRMVTRSLGRNPRRSAFTVTGVALALGLVLVFAGLRDTVSTILDRQFSEIDRSDGQLQATSPAGTLALVAAAGTDPDVARAEPVTRADATLDVDGRTVGTLLVGLSSDTTLHQFTSRSGAPLALGPGGGVLLGDGLRTTLQIKVGDIVTVQLPATGTVLREPVTGFLAEPLAAVAYVANEHLATIAGAPAPTGVLVEVKPGADPATVGARLAALPGAAAWADNAATEAAMRKAFSIMDALVALMLAFAVVMAAALLFNAMSANVAERSVELGTLQAAGMPRSTISRLVAVENLLLTVIGLPIGIVAGTLAARWFMSRYENLGYRWSLEMRTSTYVVATLTVLAAAALAQLQVRRSLGRIDIGRIVRERSL